MNSVFIYAKLSCHLRNRKAVGSSGDPGKQAVERRRIFHLLFKHQSVKPATFSRYVIPVAELCGRVLKVPMDQVTSVARVVWIVPLENPLLDVR
jgi:hypothetical protein